MFYLLIYFSANSRVLLGSFFLSLTRARGDFNRGRAMNRGLCIRLERFTVANQAGHFLPNRFR